LVGWKIFLNPLIFVSFLLRMYAWPDGSMYEGEFKDGLHEGQGTYKFVDGGVYAGEWKQGQYHGTHISINTKMRLTWTCVAYFSYHFIS
jgi:hypothetical protein